MWRSKIYMTLNVSYRVGQIHFHRNNRTTCYFFSNLVFFSCNTRLLVQTYSSTNISFFATLMLRCWYSPFADFSFMKLIWNWTTMTSPVMRWTFVFVAVTAILSVRLFQDAKKLMNGRKVFRPQHPPHCWELSNWSKINKKQNRTHLIKGKTAVCERNC